MINNIRGAFSSIWHNKVTSLLTILGVVIGVTSVIVLISLGQGLKNDVSSIIQGMGSNILAVVGGKIDTNNIQSQQQVNPAQFIAGDILTSKDVASIASLDSIDDAVPMGMVSLPLKNGDKVAMPMVIGTTSGFLDSVDLVDLEFGSNIDDTKIDKTVVLSAKTKQALFGDQDALSKTVNIGEQSFTVIGLLKQPEASIMSNDYENLAIISFNNATIINKNQEKIFRIIAKAKDETDINKVKEDIKNTLIENHNGEEDFSVLTQEDLLGLMDQFLDLATTMVTAIAAISLIVGGIGIMNIMLITVTERTREIGLRKAIGASRGAILSQFLVEAIIITLLGGIIGLTISFITNYTIRNNSTLNPEINASIVLLALGLSTVIGVLFGIWPALRAAQKDPIEALRHE
ncbi:MAG: Macrolide export ATP-binding/permease protein MacB [bacterium ADurb.Bin212]|nr:MAG: Macrolide export ATP-binding/permease protein MacB [bacterium ADurb.Bin212]